MATFEVKIQGMEELIARLDPGSLQTNLAKGLGKATINLHNALKTSIADTYNSPEILDKVLVQPPESTVVVGKNSFHSHLEYRFKPIPLSKFPAEEKTIFVSSRFLIKRPTGGYRPIDKSIALVPYVKVRKDRNSKPVTGRKGFGGFIIKPSRRNTGSAPWPAGKSARKGIYERQQNETWTSQGQEKQNASSLFNRAKIKPLFGPSLSQMAGTMFVTNPKVGIAIRDFSKIVSVYIDL